MSTPVSHDMRVWTTLQDGCGRYQRWFNSPENTPPVQFQACKATEIEHGGVSMFIWIE
jgi:hypothetical protein